MLDVVRASGEWEAWLDFFLEGVDQTASGAVRITQRLTAIFQEDSRRIKGLGRSGTALLRVFDALCERPIVTVNEICRRADVSFPTATKSMQTLTNLGIARELTSQRRNRVFVYDRYLSILNGEMEP